VVLITGAGKRGDAGRVKALGFAGYLVKPIRASQLRGCLALLKKGSSALEESRRGSAEFVTRHSVSEAMRKRSRVLVVEDNPVNQRVASHILSKLGVSVEIASHGEKALAVLARADYDLVFTDIEMPGMDGFELTRKIRGLSGNVRTVPVVAMTAHALKGMREKCLGAGLDDYVSKPVQIERLTEILNRWIGQRSEISVPSD